MFKSLFALAAVATGAVQAATIRRADPTLTDNDILNYALTLEHLESAFYAGAVAQFNQSSFASGEEHALFEQIASHEATHVQILQTVLGNAAVAACNYSFPYTDVQSFKALAQVLEGVGVTAYLGAAQFLSSKTLLTAAGSILTTEARHAAWLATVNGADPWSGAFDTPLSPDDVFSLASSFITSCPSTNAALPVKAFPALTANPASNLTAGQAVTFSTAASGNGSLFVAFLTGTTSEFVPYTVNQSVTIPSTVNATGTIYAVVTTSNTTVSDDNTVAGPAIIMFNAQFPAGTNVTNSAGQTPGSSGSGSSGSGSGSSSSGSGSSSGAASPSRSVGVAAAISLAVVAATMLAL